jgi:hypothetical protein
VGFLHGALCEGATLILDYVCLAHGLSIDLRWLWLLTRVVYGRCAGSVAVDLEFGPVQHKDQCPHGFSSVA